MLKKEDYAYAVGRVRAMEKNLLDRSKIERMADARTAEDALKVLGETEYAEYLAELKNVYEFETLLEHELYRVYKELGQIKPLSPLISLFAWKFDYHNFKVLFKSHELGEKRDELLIEDLGNVPLSEIYRAIHEDDYTDLPPAMRQGAELLAEAFHLNPDPRLVDLPLDGAMYRSIMIEVEKIGSEFIHGYFTREIDLINIKTFLRVKRMDQATELLKKALIPFGSLNLEKMVQPAEPLEVLVDRLMWGPYGPIVEEGIQAYQKTDTLTRFEKLADDFLIHYLQKAKFITFGPEPVAGYLLAKEMELKLIRLLLVSKINQLPTETIWERLRDVYA